ncbi:hypothetical protein Q31b_40670 [Novipirellula aureliae]|uniref:STAS domain-containing protein n=2 Tax=Novipirellula aureliae TaxID=2527966 RepID=A0A5C6DQF6_9BACT|nr:hypothetical protein Q31b_40670 [Novipirellula aureliae]
MYVDVDHKRTPAPAAGSSKHGAPKHWLAAARRGLEQGSETEILVDLRSVELISSQEIGELIRLQLSARQKSRRLVLNNPQPNLLEVFTLTRLDRLIELRHSAVTPATFV